MKKLRGKVAIVTGAARGIGFAIAQRFVNEGATGATYDVNAAKLEEAATKRATREGRINMIGVAIVVLICGTPFAAISAEQAPDPESGVISLQQLEVMFDEISNWGRWGKEDELGTLNLITPEIIAKAAALVEHGVSVSLAGNLDKEESDYNPRPFEHSSRVHDSGNHVGLFDKYTLEYHGAAHAHIDSLNHIAYRGKSYNGFPVDEIHPQGPGKLGIHTMANGIISRGVLVDIPWLKGVDFLNRGEAITVADLEAWEVKAGITIGTGDVLLVRTGRWVLDQKHGALNLAKGGAGLHVSVVKWLKQRDVAALGSDAGNDVIPSGVEGEMIPVHLLTIAGLGMPLFDNLHLDALASEVLKNEKREFLFVAAPMRVEGGTGAPINPLAVF